MRLIHPASPRQLNLGLAILRVIVGVIFAAHGGQKLFVYGLDGVAGTFGQMGIPLASLTAPAVALVEFFGGLALILGLLTRLAGFGLAVTMLGALLLVHLRGGFFLPTGYEYVLALLGASAALTITGGGRYSLDALLAERRTTARSEQPQLQGA
ncbi:MAG TPA: DoxX family protein [Gemmatimonadales bacterium]|nr:DoxX family protein [Gemmatimonadales bacterium]